MEIIGIIQIILAMIAMVCGISLAIMLISECCTKIHDDYYSDEIDEGWR